MLSRSASLTRRSSLVLIFVVAAFIVFSNATSATAHPLGNFTINHFARIATGTDRVRLHYVIDMAEIPTFQELQTIDTDRDGKPSSAELNAYAERLAAQYADGLLLTIDNTRIPLSVTAKQAATVPGAGGLPTLRLECDLAGDIPAANATGGGDAKNARRLRFEDTNHRERIGWHEIVVVPASGVAVFDSNAYGTSATNELRNYPQDMLAAPLDERLAEFSFAAGSVPANSTALRTRDGHAVDQTRDRFAELINVEELTPTIALFGLLIAALLGALHAFSPGHGKTVVGAYLVGSRGTAGHAAFLGLTVTVTHTIGVFALGLITLFASQYVMPERLYPILGFISGGIVLAMGLSLFVQRLRSALNPASVEANAHAHVDLADAHAQVDVATHELLNADADKDHAQLDLAKNPALVHSHGGSVHSHLPPGADGGGVTWRSLLALGISGGLLPCPSALVVLLSAITLHRVGYGMFLVVAFSLGLACTLTAIGLAFVYAGRWMKRPAGSGRLVRLLPVVSALVVACIGLGLCFQALGQAGYNFSSVMSRFTTQSQAVTRSNSQGKVF